MRPGPRSGRWAALAIAASLAPVALVAALGGTVVWRDSATLYAPLRGLVTEALRAGRLPLWNPYEGTGMPLFAQAIHGVLHPASVATALVFPAAPLDLLLAAHLALAALGAFLLARTLVAASPPAAAVAATAYGLSGFVLSMAGNLPYLAAAGSAPWVLLGGVLAGRSWAGAAALAPAVAVLHLAGDPQWAVVAAVLALGLAALEGRGAGLARAAAGLALGTALAAVQLHPSWAFLQRTDRVLELAAAEQAQWALAPARLVEFLVPGLFSGRPLTVAAPVFLWLGGPSPGYALPFAASVYLGAPVILLAAAGLRRSRQTRFLGAAALVLLWMALGESLWATQLLGQVPVWSRFRYAEKLVAPAALLLSILAGSGADRLTGGVPRWLRRAALAALVAAIGATLALVATPDGVEALLRGGGAGRAAPVARRQLLEGLLHLVAALAATVAVLRAIGRGPGPSPSAPAWMAGLVVATSLAAAPFAIRNGERDAARRPAAADLGEGVRLATPVSPVVNPTPDSLDRLLRIRSSLGLPPLGAPAGVGNVDNYVGLHPRRHEFLYQALGQDRWRAFRRWGVTHVALPAGAARGDPAARAAIEGGRLIEGSPPGIELYEVPHRPWATFAPAAEAIPGQRATLARTVELARAGDPTVVVEADAAPPTAPGRVLEATRAPERLRIVAESEGNALLVVNEAYWPGWTAHVDGAPVALLPADVLVRAVPWPAGRHELVMRYAPEEVDRGLLVTAAAAVAWALFAAWAARRRAAGA